MVSVKPKYKASLDMSSKRSRVAKVPSLKQEVPKPVECSLLKWQRIQVNRYLTQNPTAKGKTVQEQIYRQKPVPWPGVTVRQLNTLIRKLNSSQIPENQSVHKSSTIHHIIYHLWSINSQFGGVFLVQPKTLHFSLHQSDLTGCTFGVITVTRVTNASIFDF